MHMVVTVIDPRSKIPSERGAFGLITAGYVVGGIVVVVVLALAWVALGPE